MNDTHRMDVARWARFYRSRGLNPIPSHPEHGFPWYAGYSQDRDRMMPEEKLLSILSGDNSEIQVATGGRWGFAPIDLDGEEAKSYWRWMSNINGGCPATWTQHTPRGGLHLWFRLPDHVKSLPHKTTLERLRGEHAEVALLGDKNLARAVPSRRTSNGVVTGQYVWQEGSSPFDLSLPAVIPPWVLAWAARVRHKTQAQMSRAWNGDGRAVALTTNRPVPLHRNWRDVLDAIPDKLELLRRAGVRIVGDPFKSPNGWAAARALDRPDVHPSAAVSRSGYYWEPEIGVRSLFHVLAERGLYPTWWAAVDYIGEDLNVPPSSKKSRKAPFSS